MDQIVIIGNPSRKDQDEPIIKKAGELFSKSVYVPITEIRIKSNGRMYHDKMDLSRYQVLPIPTNKYSDTFLSIASSSAGYMPYTAEALLLFQKKALGLSKLRNAGFTTLDLFNIISDSPLDSIIQMINFPVDITIGDISARVRDDSHLKDLVKMRRPGQAITIKEPIEYPLTGCFVIGNEVIAVRIENDKEKLRGISIGSRLAELAVNAVSTLGSNYGFICLSNEKIVSITMAPNFAAIEKVTNKDVATPLIRHMQENIPIHKERTIFDKIVEVVRSKI